MPTILNVTKTLQTIAGVDNWTGLHFKPNGSIEKQSRCQIFGKIFCCHRFRPQQEIPQLRQTITTFVDLYKKETKDAPRTQLTLIQGTVSAFNTYIGFLNQQQWNIDSKNKLDAHNLLGDDLLKVLKQRELEEWLKNSPVKITKIQNAPKKEGEGTNPEPVKEGEPSVKKEGTVANQPKETAETGETDEAGEFQLDWDSDEEVDETGKKETAKAFELPNVKATFDAVQIEGEKAVLATAQKPLVVTKEATKLANKVCDDIDLNSHVLRNGKKIQRV
jgi:hypothetical protein